MTPIYRDEILSYWAGDSGLDRGSINIDGLFSNPKELSAFFRRLDEFMNSHEANAEIIKVVDNRLEFLTTSTVPKIKSDKPKLFLLFGNPAPHSVKAGGMFSSEGNNKEHRVWQFLADTDVLKLDHRKLLEPFDVTWRIKLVLQGNYKSPFHIGMTSFISFPSSASDKKWSGVAGVRKLFGANAFSTICQSEYERVQTVMRSFMPSGGIVIALQRDGYNMLRTDSTPPYSMKKCMAGELYGASRTDHKSFLAGVPPTRLALSRKVKEVFVNHVNKGLSQVDNNPLTAYPNNDSALLNL